MTAIADTARQGIGAGFFFFRVAWRSSSTVGGGVERFTFRDGAGRAFGRAEEEGAKASLLCVRPPPDGLLAKPDEKCLREIVGVCRIETTETDEAVNRLPVGAAKLIERGERSGFPVQGRPRQHAPMCRRKIHRQSAITSVNGGQSAS